MPSLRKTTSLLLALLAALPALCHAQDASPPADSVAYVLVETNLDGAVLYAQGRALGAVTDQPLAVPAAADTVRLSPPRRLGWSVAPQDAALDAAPGDTVRLHLAFPYHHRLDTSPPNTEAFLVADGTRRPLGRTPLVVVSDTLIDGRFVLERPGYETAEVVPGRQVWNAYVLDLRATPGSALADAALVELEDTRSRRWIDALALGVGLGATALSIHYKFKANRRYDAYRATGDEALYEEVQRLDTRAGIAFGVGQAGVAVFGIRLVLR